MTNVKYRALLCKRFKDLNDLIYNHAFDRYFYAMEVAGFLHDAVATEEDILVAMMLAADLAQWSGLPDELNARILHIADARATETILSTADAGVLAALTIVELQAAINEYHRADLGWLHKNRFEDFKEQGKAFEVLGAIYLQVKDHPFGQILKDLIHRAMAISKMEADVFIDERPVYEITPAQEGTELPKFIRSMVEKLYLDYSSHRARLYVSSPWYEGREILPVWANMIQAHHPELRVVKSSKKYSEFDWERKKCQSLMEAWYRHSIQSLFDWGCHHEPNRAIDPYEKLMNKLGLVEKQEAEPDCWQSR